MGTTTVWYVKADRTRINFSTAIVSSVAQFPIYRIEQNSDTPLRLKEQLWASAGMTLDAAKIAAAQAEASSTTVPTPEGPSPTPTPPAPAGAATEGTLLTASLALAAVQTLLTAMKSPYGGQVTTTAQHRWRSEFNSYPNSAWTLSQTGTGMGASAANGVLSLTSGTTSGDTLTLLGNPITRSVTIPTKIAFGFKLSQKIANFELYLELLAVNDDNTVDETVVAAWKFAGSESTTATVGRYEVRNGTGTTGRVQSANATINSVLADNIVEIQPESDECWFHSKLIDNTAARGASFVEQKTSPDPTRRYVPRIRMVNGVTAPATGTVTPGAPASNTTVSLYFVTGMDYAEHLTEIVGGAGDVAAGRTMAVSVVGTPAVTLTSTAVGANASVTGTTIAKLLSAATTNATLVKSSAARVYGWHLANTSASWRFVRLYNKTTAPTVGTDSPVLVIPIPPGGVAAVHHTAPISFATGLGYSITGASADLDTTVVAVGDVVGHLLYA